MTTVEIIIAGLMPITALVLEDREEDIAYELVIMSKKITHLFREDLQTQGSVLN